ncbi:MAG: hypothetical protein JRH11_05950 [Deltaproteobacteria bacterium]|nr:hypothetical protein [Deltaproteobacteria bacterium]
MHRIPFVIALALGAICAAPAAAQPVTEGSQSEAADDAYDGYDEDDDYDEYEDEGFCGGEESSYDDAYYSFEDGDFEGASEILVAALRDEDLYDQRTYYLALLGQAQLRLNDTRHATVNFRRSIAAESAGTYSTGARVGLAIALLQNGQRQRAQDVAAAYADERCGPDERSALNCYVAFVVSATAARDDEARAKGREGARRMRSEMDQYELPALAYYDTAFDVAAWPEPVSAPTDLTGNAETRTAAEG